METIAITVFQVSVNVCILHGCLHYKGVLEPYLRILFKGKRAFRISCLIFIPVYRDKYRVFQLYAVAGAL
mgnify:CR=1 FL=1